MHETIRTILEAGRPIILDGGWGTQLQARGLSIGDCPDTWNLDHPDRVEAVARDYVDAGSQIILTNTFGANRYTLAKCGWEDKAAEVNRAGVELSKRAAGDRACVFASIGPSGVMLMMGEVTADELRAAFVEQAEAMAAAGAEGLVIETMSDPDEAKLAVEAAKTTGLPVVGCMVFDTGPDNDRTMMGTSPEDSVEILTAAGADVIGSNCGQGITGFVKICSRLRAATDLPLWIKGNAGLPQMVDGQTVYEQTPEEFADEIPPLVEAGANFIGGCCGTTPDFIRAVATKLGQ